MLPALSQDFIPVISIWSAFIGIVIGLAKSFFLAGDVELAGLVSQEESIRQLIQDQHLNLYYIAHIQSIMHASSSSSGNKEIKNLDNWAIRSRLPGYS